MKNKDLQYFTNLDYVVMIKKAGDSYYLFVPELSQLVKGTSLDEAYQEMEKRKKEYFQAAIESGNADLIAEPRTVVRRTGIGSGVMTYAVKCLVTVCLLAGMLVVLVFAFDNYAVYRLGQLRTGANAWISQEAPSYVISGVSARLRQISSEDDKQIRAKAREYFRFLKPTLEELRLRCPEPKGTVRKPEPKDSSNPSR